MPRKGRAKVQAEEKKLTQHEQYLIQKFGSSMAKELDKLRTAPVPASFGKPGRPSFLDRPKQPKESQEGR